jgi:hypothetical protein
MASSGRVRAPGKTNVPAVGDALPGLLCQLDVPDRSGPQMVGRDGDCSRSLPIAIRGSSWMTRDASPASQPAKTCQIPNDVSASGASAAAEVGPSRGYWGSTAGPPYAAGLAPRAGRVPSRFNRLDQKGGSAAAARQARPISPSPLAGRVGSTAYWCVNTVPDFLARRWRGRGGVSGAQ